MSLWGRTGRIGQTGQTGRVGPTGPTGQPRPSLSSGLAGVALIPPVLALAWGLNWPAVRLMLATLPPFTLRWLGLGLGALLLLGFAALRGARLWPPRAALPFVLLSGLLAVAGFNLCTVFAQLSTSTSRAAVLTFTFPLMSALLAWPLLGERPGRRGLAALALGGLGIALLAWPALQRQAGPGLLWPLAAALCWAGSTVITKRWPPPEASDRLVLTAWQLALGAAVAGVGAAVVGEALPTRWPAPVLGALLFHVVVATALAYVLWYRLLAARSATVASLTTLAVPVVGVLGAMALVGERPSGLDLAGFALVLGGAALAVLRLGRG